PASADAAVRVASTTSGRIELTRGSCEGMDFDTQTLSRSPSCIQTRAKPQVTASWIPACLKSLVLRIELPPFQYGEIDRYAAGSVDRCWAIGFTRNGDRESKDRAAPPQMPRL